jgi:hypothetical protein
MAATNNVEPPRDRGADHALRMRRQFVEREYLPRHAIYGDAAVAGEWSSEDTSLLQSYELTFQDKVTEPSLYLS